MRKKWRDIWNKKQEEITLETPQNEYYENISARLGIVQVVLYLSLFAFVVLSLFRNTNLITYRNFYYFFKDLNASAETVDVFSSDSVTYPTGNVQSFTLYRGGLSVAGNNAVTIFTATGRQTVSENISYENPVAVGSGKYLLVYEMGGTQYSLYNSYTQIFSGKSDHPLQGAAVSDSGMYALISSSKEYTSVVSLYSSNFSLLNRYHKNGYVMDVAVNAKGSLLGILTSSVQNGIFCTELELYEPGEKSPRVAVNLGSELSLSCEFTSSGYITVLSRDRISYVNQNGKITESFELDGKEILCVDQGKDGIAVSLQSSAISEKNHIIVFDKNGKMLYNEDVPKTVEEISRFGSSVFLLFSGAIGMLDVSDGELLELSCHSEQRKILAVDEKEVLICSPQKAEYVRFSS